jgi:hypothetical protein
MAATGLATVAALKQVFGRHYHILAFPVEIYAFCHFWRLRSRQTIAGRALGGQFRFCWRRIGIGSLIANQFIAGSGNLSQFFIYTAKKSTQN